MLISDKYSLDDIVIMPNAHLVNKNEIELSSSNCHLIFAKIKKIFEDNNIHIIEGSFGYDKLVKLVIMGHPKAYSFREI